jgi:putative nucleotidyltransferase with HDIG domain
VALLSSCVTPFQNRNAGWPVLPEALELRQSSAGPARLMIHALARMMRARDAATHQHAERVQRYAVALAAAISGGDEAMMQAVDAAAILHDIGKLALPDRLLHKPGPLTCDEYERVKQHAAMGADMLAGICFDAPISLIVRHHHENWDGTGYPDGLRGTSIPIGARVLSVVDCYDALTSKRPYRRELPHEAALAMIQDRRERMFDPEITDAFVGMVHDLRPAPVDDLTPAIPATAFELRAARVG